MSYSQGYGKKFVQITVVYRSVHLCHENTGYTNKYVFRDKKNFILTFRLKRRERCKEIISLFYCLEL